MATEASSYVAAEAAFRKHLEDVAMELPTSTQDLENSTAAVQGGPLAPQASSADAPAVDEQDECATTDDECAAADRISRRPGGPPPCHSASRWPSPLAGGMRPRPRSLRTRPNPPPRRRWTLTLTLTLTQVDPHQGPHGGGAHVHRGRQGGALPDDP